MPRQGRLPQEFALVGVARTQMSGATHKFSDTALQAAATLDLRRPTTASEHSDDPNPAGGGDLPRFSGRRPGPDVHPDTVDMDFCYTDHFGGRNSAA